MLLAEVLSVKRFDLYLKFDQPLSKNELTVYRQYVKKRSERYPFSYIVNKAWFLDYEFYVDERVLIPRGDTERLYERAVKLINETFPDVIVDIGTGSGCLAISLKKQFPNKKVIAVDISKNAIDVAEKNANILDADIEFLNKNVMEIDFNTFGNKTFIVSNPPYIPIYEMESLDPEVKKEPLNALEAGEDGCIFYDSVLSAANASDNVLGVAFEIGHNIEQNVLDLCKKYGLKNIESTKDYSKIVRVIDGLFLD